MLQFVLEFATTKPTSVSPAEDSRQAASSPTPPSAPLSEAIAKESRCLPFSTLLFLEQQHYTHRGHKWDLENEIIFS